MKKFMLVLVGATLVAGGVLLLFQPAQPKIRPETAPSSTTTVMLPVGYQSPSRKPTPQQNIYEPAPEGVPGQLGPITYQPTPTGTPDQTSAIETGKAFMAAYVRTDLPADKWLAGISPYVTDETRSEFATTNPAQIRAHKTGAARALSTGGSYSMHVYVMTDVGEYRVVLIRDGHYQGWRVGRVFPPPQIGEGV